MEGVLIVIMLISFLVFLERMASKPARCSRVYLADVDWRGIEVSRTCLRCDKVTIPNRLPKDDA